MKKKIIKKYIFRKYQGKTILWTFKLENWNKTVKMKIQTDKLTYKKQCDKNLQNVQHKRPKIVKVLFFRFVHRITDDLCAMVIS